MASTMRMYQLRVLNGEGHVVGVFDVDCRTHADAFETATGFLQIGSCVEVRHQGRVLKTLVGVADTESTSLLL